MNISNALSSLSTLNKTKKVPANKNQTKKKLFKSTNKLSMYDKYTIYPSLHLIVQSQQKKH